MEYDTERAGGFEPLRHAPDDKLIVLGLVTTKTPENDDKEMLKRRIDEAAQYVPIENLALSPQCGFASVAEGNSISLADQRRKRELDGDLGQASYPRLRARRAAGSVPEPARTSHGTHRITTPERAEDRAIAIQSVGEHMLGRHPGRA